MSMSYQSLALIYDRLMEEAPYDRWVRFTLERWHGENRRVEHAVDLGCGTGSVAIPLSDYGFRVHGIDASADMLAVAKNKAEAKGMDIAFYEQDIREWSLGFEVDSVFSYCDVLNYILDEADVKRVFSCVCDALKPGGLFLFDVHAPKAAKAIFDNETFTWVEEDVSYIWETDLQSNVVRHDLTLFVREGSLYRRTDETHWQCLHPPQRLRRWLADAGFEIVACTADFGQRDVEDDESERLFFVARKSA